ncbi:MAG: aminotransferase class I and II [Solirubrobacterales bacterium]|nr:aminotransferase class I and II [Solirubrobacterales bacterium]
MLRSITATRYVTPLKEGGSLPGLVEADDDGLYVVKFRAAGQGSKALVAELIVGELARAAGLPVPELVLANVPDTLGRTEPDPEINQLVTDSAGLNVGMDFLPGALDYTPARPESIDPELASRIVWFDALTTNVDRTPRNPNLLVWHGRPFLIDHGAALYRHHASDDLLPHAADPFPLIADHVLLPRATALAQADRELGSALTPALVAEVLTRVPDGLLGDEPRGRRDNYVAYLSARLAGSHTFLQQAEAARGS